MNQEINESESNSIESKALTVSNTTSFKELLDVIDDIAPIKGSQQVYSADELVGIIHQVQNGQRDISFVTSTAGLRQKVSELLSLKVTQVPYKVEGHGSYDFFDSVYSDKTLSEIFTRIFNQKLISRNMAGGKFTPGELFSFLENEAPTRERFIAYVEAFYQNIAEKNSEANLTKELEALKVDTTLDKMDKSFKMQRIQEKLRNSDSVAKLPDNLEEAADIIYGTK